MRQDLDDTLRAEGAYAPEAAALPGRTFALAVLGAALFYGAVMGSYGLRPGQAFHSALKLPMLLAVSGLICLPNFLVLNTILGLRPDLGRVLRGAMLAQATISLCLAALAPLTAFAYVSLTVYGDAVIFNGVVFLVAALAGQVTLGRHYRPLIAANPRHRIARDAWLALYVFVAIQTAWVLRPFVGDPGQETRFLREGAWSNAYVELFALIWRTLRG